MFNTEFNNEAKEITRDQIVARIQHFNDFLNASIKDHEKNEDEELQNEIKFIKEKYETIFEGIISDYSLY